MTRYTSIDPADGYQGTRRFSLTASRQTARAHPVGAHIIGLQTDADNPNEKGRKRIAVACSRCRKRKIKCSGDPKNGQGCQNCRNAGSDPGQCQFLRVSSSSIECVEWPYAMSNGPQYAGNATIGIFGIGGQGVNASIPTSMVPPRRMQHSWPYVYPSLPPASDYYDYDMASQEAAYDPAYAFQQPSGGFAAPDHRSGQHTFSSPELLRQWSNLPKVERIQLATFNSPPSTTTLGSSGMTYPVSLAPMTSVDPNICFPSMGSLVNSLPRSSQKGIRLLSTPKPENSQVESESQLVTAAPGYGLVSRSAASPPISWYQGRAVLEPHSSAPEMERNHSQGPTSYLGCAKMLASSARDHSMAYNRVADTVNSSVPPENEALSSSFDLQLTSTSANGANESLAYGTTAPEAHDLHRARVPSTGSLSYSTASASPKRGSVSSSGTDNTLLHGATHQGAAHLRHIQPAQTQMNTQTLVHRS